MRRSPRSSLRPFAKYTVCFPIRRNMDHSLAFALTLAIPVTVVSAKAQQRFTPFETCPPGAADLAPGPDIDGDGLIDLVTCGPTGLGIMFGLGSGQFGSAVSVGTLPGGCSVAHWGDIDGDGDLDLLSMRTLSGSGGPALTGIALNLNEGGRTFSSDVVIDLGLGATVMDGLEDMNGDGMVDIVLRTPGPGTTSFSVRRAAGFGFFEATAPLFQISGDTGDVQVLDLDRDGDPDALGVIFLPGNVSRVWAAFRGPSGSYSISDADLPAPLLDVEPIETSSGRLDLLVSVDGFFTSSAVFLVRQSAPGQLDVAVPTGIVEDSFIGELIVADFDGDGVEDWVRVGQQESFLVLQAPPGTFTAFPIPPTLVATQVEIDAVDINGDGVLDLVQPLGAGCALNLLDSLSIGDSFCAGAPVNSTGLSGFTAAFGDARVAVNRVRLEAWPLPQDVFGFFLVSRAPANVFPVPMSTGRLCLGGMIGRFNRPGQILNSGAAGRFELRVFDYPSNVGPPAAGETFFFQAWHRDVGSFGPSNFTEGLRIEFM